MHSKFGPLPMLNLIIALREKHIPLEALVLTYFTEDEQRWIRRGFDVSMIELIDAALKLEGK